MCFVSIRLTIERAAVRYVPVVRIIFSQANFTNGIVGKKFLPKMLVSQACFTIKSPRPPDMSVQISIQMCLGMPAKTSLPSPPFLTTQHVEQPLLATQKATPRAPLNA